MPRRFCRPPDASAEERAQAQRIIARQIENMSRMIDDLLDVSRITEGKIELRKKPVALEGDPHRRREPRALRLRRARPGTDASRCPPSRSFSNADATRLEQVFGNLLTNACKYSGDGCHIALSAERDPCVEPPEVIVRVRDDGVGIDARAAAARLRSLRAGQPHAGPRARRPGHRPHARAAAREAARRQRRGAQRGAGPGRGIHRPPAHPPRSPAARAAPAAARHARRRRAASSSWTTTPTPRAASPSLQSRRGHETRTAFTGPDAVAAAAEFLPEVVLLDIGLPGMDGFEVARQLRAMPALDGVFLIAMSGYGSDEDRAEAQAAGFDEYLVKPVDLDLLRELLRKPELNPEAGTRKNPNAEETNPPTRRRVLLRAGAWKNAFRAG